MSHPNALLNPRDRLPLAPCVVDQCWRKGSAAERFRVRVPTTAHWTGKDPLNVLRAPVGQR